MGSTAWTSSIVVAACVESEVRRASAHVFEPSKRTGKTVPHGFSAHDKASGKASNASDMRVFHATKDNVVLIANTHAQTGEPIQYRAKHEASL